MHVSVPTVILAVDRFMNDDSQTSTSLTDDAAHRKVVETLFAVGRVLILMALPAIGWLASEVLAHRDSIKVIEATRFTRADGVAIEQEVRRSIEGLRAEVALLPKEVPPAWFLERVTRLETAEEKLEERTLEILELLRQLQGEIKALKEG